MYPTRTAAVPVATERHPTAASDEAHAPERTSVLIGRLLGDLQGEDVSIGFIVVRLRRRSFGGILILLAALGLLPGVSFFAGLAMLVPAVQMMVGLRAPHLPRFIRRRRVATGAVRALGRRTIPLIEKLERIVRPRWLRLAKYPWPAVVGGMTFALGLVVMLPLPFSNFPPALALLSFALGLLERDGVLIAIGLALSVAALAIGGVVTVAAIEAATMIIGKLAA